jgi:hypothetical protein
MERTMSETRKVRLFNGPMHNTDLELPVDQKLYRIGKRPIPFWTYEDTKLKDPEGRALFALRPRSRPVAKFLKLAIKASGKDQRLFAPAQPTRYPEKHDRRFRKFRKGAKARYLKMLKRLNSMPHQDGVGGYERGE